MAHHGRSHNDTSSNKKGGDYGDDDVDDDDDDGDGDDCSEIKYPTTNLHFSIPLRLC